MEVKNVPAFENDEFNKIVEIIIKDNKIRKTKPKVNDNDPITGKAAYVWRMVVFYVSPNSRHHCMPVAADFDLPAFDENGKWRTSIAREMAKELDVLVDKIVDLVPPEQRYGLNAWAKAFGKI